jgi:hypothetical protein
MSAAPLPPGTTARLGSASFGSTLSSADHSSTLAAGLEPVGIVQGTCVMRWAWYGPRSPYGGASPIGSGSRKLKRRYYDPKGGDNASWSGGFFARRAVKPIVYASKSMSSWPCQHGAQRGGGHEPGVNFEQNWLEDLWSEGFTTARARMLTEAEIAGAHGVVGVVDEINTPTHGIKEFLLRGTAVRVTGVAAPREIWSTYLAGERLIKLVEAGWAPVSVVAALASVRIWPACSTESQLRGTWREVAKIRQLESGHYVARALARDHVHTEAGSDDVHGVRYEVGEHRIARGDDEVTCTMWGSRIRRFAVVDRLSAPMRTLTLR